MLLAGKGVSSKDAFLNRQLLPPLLLQLSCFTQPIPSLPRPTWRLATCPGITPCSCLACPNSSSFPFKTRRQKDLKLIKPSGNFSRGKLLSLIARSRAWLLVPLGRGRVGKSRRTSFESGLGKAGVIRGHGFEPRSLCYYYVKNANPPLRSLFQGRRIWFCCEHSLLCCWR